MVFVHNHASDQNCHVMPLQYVFTQRLASSQLTSVHKYRLHNGVFVS